MTGDPEVIPDQKSASRRSSADLHEARRIALRDVFRTHHPSGAASCAAGVPRTSGLHFLSRVFRQLTAGWSRERMAGHANRLSALDVGGQWYRAHACGPIFSVPWPGPRRRSFRNGEDVMNIENLFCGTFLPGRRSVIANRQGTMIERGASKTKRMRADLDTRHPCRGALHRTSIT